MRTMSALKALCPYPEVIDAAPSARRDEAAALGDRCHKAVNLWVMSGDTSHFAQLGDPAMYWLQALASSWQPPEALEMEVPLGLGVSPDGDPEYVAVREEPTGSHNYVTLHNATLVTAGRADLIAPARKGLLNVDDMKSGKFYLGPPGNLTQVLAQGIAATLRVNADGFIPGVFYFRVNHWDRGEPIVRGTAEWDRAWKQVHQAATLPSRPFPGGWCLSCWSRTKCPSNPEVVA